MQTMIAKVPQLQEIIDDQLTQEEAHGEFNYNCEGKSYPLIPPTFKEFLESITTLKGKGVQINKEPLTLKGLLDIPTERHKHLQAFLTDQLRQPRLEDVKKTMNPAQLSIFSAGDSSAAGSWTDIIPSNDLHMQMSDAQFIHAAKRRIILIDEADAGQTCGCAARAIIDQNWIHKMNCAWAAGKGRISTHDDLKFDLAAFFTSGGLSVKWEQRLWKKTHNSEERMDLIVRAGAAPGMAHAIYDMDLTIVNAMTSKTTNSSTKTNVETILNEAVTRKQRKYSEKSKSIGHHFVALAFFVQGNWHKDFANAVYWKRRISATIQKGISNHLLESSRRIHKRQNNFFQQMNSLAT